MALRLGRAIAAERTIEVGYGVSFSFRPFSFADFKEAEAAAMRLARDGMPAMMAVELEAVDDEDVAPEVEDNLRGRAAANLVRLLIRRFGTGWDGIEAEDGSPAPFDAEHIGQAFELFPGIIQMLQQSLMVPFQEVAREGKPSAPSQSTA
ncbi:MAG: hypothetical protein CML66_25900 [Rhodobacteraceae bacterium]|nr:hypothetical protein [Paracoccaceae bacterium]MAY44642.1 hypothetical protein [Paracoccaceae bacterium]